MNSGRKTPITVEVDDDGDAAGNLSAIYKLYAYYFRFVHRFGLIPLRFDRETDTVTVIKSGFAYWLWLGNSLYVGGFVCKQAALLVYNHATKYKYDTIKGGFMFQGLWLSGYLLMTSIFFNYVFNLEQAAQTMSMWLKLERYIAVHFRQDSAPKRKRRLLIIKLQFIICGFAIVGCLFTISAMAFGIPHFPPFINSVVLRPFLDHERSTGASMLTRPVAIHVRTYALSLLESYTGFMAWAVVSSFDLLLTVMCGTVNHGLRKVAERVQTEEQQVTFGSLRVYAALRVIVTNLNLAFSQLLFLQEIFSMIATVLVLYGGLKHSANSVLLAAFFFVNTIALTTRIYLLYLPMASVYTGSLRFRRLLAVKLSEQYQQAGMGAQAQAQSTGIRRRIRACRYMVFRPMGFHRVSPTSIADYMLAVLSYLVTSKNI